MLNVQGFGFGLGLLNNCYMLGVVIWCGHGLGKNSSTTIEMVNIMGRWVVQS